MVQYLAQQYIASIMARNSLKNWRIVDFAVSLQNSFETFFSIHKLVFDNGKGNPIKGVLSNLYLSRYLFCHIIHIGTYYTYGSYRKDVISLHRTWWEMKENAKRRFSWLVDTFIYLLCTLSITTKEYSASSTSKKEKVLKKFQGWSWLSSTKRYSKHTCII